MKRKNLRNIGIIAHVDAGKTTLTERVLYYTGAIHKAGDVHNGNTHTDFSPEERKRGITIYSAATTVFWNEHQLNIIDTPGHIDFNIEVNRSLRVLDGAVVVFDAVSGVEPQTETNWRLANQYAVPRICFVNKMDRIGSDYYRVINMIENRLGIKTAMIQIPIGSEDNFVGFIDLLLMKAITWQGRDLESVYRVDDLDQEQIVMAETYRQKLIEQVVEYDDDALETYLNGHVLDDESLKRCIRAGTLQGELTPVLCGTAFKNIGIQPLMDAVVDYLPSPVEMPAVIGIENNEGEKQRLADVDAPFSALAFKVVNDRHGSLYFARIYSGQVSSGSQVLNVITGKKERIGRIYEIQADKKEAKDCAVAGDIVAFAGLKHTGTGDTLCDINNPIVLERINVPEPVIDIAVEAKAKVDQANLEKGLRSLVAEDPSLHLKTDSETGQTLLSGMGELQLQVNLSRLQDDYGIDVNVGSPKVSYRETITQATELRYLNKKQTGGPGQYAEVELRFEPLERGEGYIFESQIVSGHIPKEYVPSVDKGIQKAAQSGTSGYPLVDLKVTLLDGTYHENDSSNIAFEWAAMMAFKEAMQIVKPVLLEPVMSIEVITPSDYLGDCIGDINRRRGLITNQTLKGFDSVIKANVPLAEMFGYIGDLRALTSGRATFTMQFDHYAIVPKQIAQFVN